MHGIVVIARRGLGPLAGLALLSVGIACAPPAAPPVEEPPGSDDRPQVSPASDARAIEIAESVLERMGGRDSWDRTRYLRWNFFGRRVHHWDRWSGNVRIESAVGEQEHLWLMNVDTGEGRVWRNGGEVTDPEQLAEALETGRRIWVNDSYWLVMPYKLLDPGVTLRYAGEREMEDGRVADVLDLTFGEGVGYTPENRYEVFVARDTGLVEQWSFFEQAEEEEPRFTMPWLDWRRFGDILLATGRGRSADWEIAAPGDLPDTVFTEP